MADGVEIGEAYVRIRPKVDGNFDADLKKGVQDPLDKLTSTAKKAFAGIAVAGFLKAGIDELGSAQAAAAQTTAALKSTGGQAGVTADDLDRLSESLANLSGADKEAVQAGGNLLLTFRNVRNEAGQNNDVYNQALGLAQDLSVAFGQDLQSSVILVGKALDNPVQGLTALQRVGVTLSAQQKQQVKDFVATGDVMAAQKIILAELTAQVGGSAEAFGETLPGQVQRARNALDDLSAEVVGGAAPAIEGLLGVVRPAVDLFSELPQPVQTGALALGAVALVAPKVVDGVGAISGVASKAKDGLETLALKGMYAKDGLGSAASGAAQLAGAIGPGLLGGALVAGTVATIAFADAQARAAAREREVAAGAKEYQTAIEDQTGSLLDNVNAVTAKKFSEGDLADRLKDTGANYRVLSEGIQTNADRLDDWRGLLESGSTGIGIFNTQLSEAAAGGDAFATELLRLSKTMSDGDFRDLVFELELVSTEYEKGTINSDVYQEALRGLGIESETTATSTDTAAAAAAGARTAFDNEADAAKRAADALSEMLQATDDLFSAQLSAEEASLATKAALEEYTAAQKDGTLTSDQRRQAGIDLLQTMQAEAEAAAGAAQKQADLDGRQFDAADSARVQRDKLAELATTLAPGSDLRAQLDGFIGQLDAVIARKDITIKIQTIAPEAITTPPRGMSDEDYLIYLLGEKGLLQRGLDGGLYRTDTGERVRAAGGRVNAGDTYRVNDGPGGGIEGLRTVDGTTWLTAGQDGTVIPASQMPQGGGSSFVANITINGDGRQAADEAMRFLRREAAFAGGR